MSPKLSGQEHEFHILANRFSKRKLDAIRFELPTILKRHPELETDLVSLLKRFPETFVPGLWLDPNNDLRIYFLRTVAPFLVLERLVEEGQRIYNEPSYKFTTRGLEFLAWLERQDE